jgi:hypothetical protein
MRPIAWIAAGIAVFLLTDGCDKPAPISSKEQRQLDLMDHPRIISKEVVARFHRIGNGLVLGTASGTLEFVKSDDCNITSPEDALKTDADLGANAFGGDEVAKQPIYLINEDAGDGPEWILQQLHPAEKNIDGTLHTEQCNITPN